MDEVERAFTAIPRENFVPDDLRSRVDIDAPLPIGFGQTISQPTTVKMMLEWLEVEPGDKVLDIGSGSGWTAALLSKLVGPEGQVFAVELVPELVEFGRRNAERLSLKNVKFFQASRDIGLPKHSPYDKILVSAAATRLPEQLLNQLKAGGKLVIPVNNDILEIEKTSKDRYETTRHPGFVFVPLLDYKNDS
jgi:protein-L-isoaspartate(D-aspartate) O-methyltransferase